MGPFRGEEIRWLVRRGTGGFGITTTAAANVTETGRVLGGGNGRLGRSSAAWPDTAGFGAQSNRYIERGTVFFTEAFVHRACLTVCSPFQPAKTPFPGMISE